MIIRFHFSNGSTLDAHPAYLLPSFPESPLDAAYRVRARMDEVRKESKLLVVLDADRDNRPNLVNPEHVMRVEVIEQS